MTEPHLDRLARLLSGSRSRRQALVALGVLTLARPLRASAASQIEPASCGDSGAVCTQLKDCCSGLVCATSTRNPTYGVCVAGEGDMLAVTDDLIVPGTPGLAEELAALVADAAAASAAIPSRGTAPAETGVTTGGTTTTTSTSPFTNTNTNTQTREKAPRLDRTLVDNDPATMEPEILTVHNPGAVPVVISRIRSISPSLEADSDVTIEIAEGDSVELHSGEHAAGDDAWTTVDICPDLDGVYLTVSRSGSTEKHRLKVLCESPPADGSTEAATRQARKKTSTKRRGKKPSKRGQKPSKRRKGQ